MLATGSDKAYNSKLRAAVHAAPNESVRRPLQEGALGLAIIQRAHESIGAYKPLAAVKSIDAFESGRCASAWSIAPSLRALLQDKLR